MGGLKANSTVTRIYDIFINELKYDDIENEQRTVLLFDIIKVKLKKLKGYKIRRYSKNIL